MSLRTPVSTVGANQWPRSKLSPSGRPPPSISRAPASTARSPKPLTLSHSGAETFGHGGELADPGQSQRGQRGDLRGLEHDGVAGQQRGADLAREDRRREVPRDDRDDDAVRLLAHHELLVPVRRRDQLADVPVALGEREVEERLHAADLATRLGDRLALLGDDDAGELLGVPVDLPDDRADDLGALAQRVSGCTVASGAGSRAPPAIRASAASQLDQDDDSENVTSRAWFMAAAQGTSSVGSSGTPSTHIAPRRRAAPTQVAIPPAV